MLKQKIKRIINGNYMFRVKSLEWRGERLEVRGERLEVKRN